MRCDLRKGALSDDKNVSSAVDVEDDDEDDDGDDDDDEDDDDDDDEEDEEEEDYDNYRRPYAASLKRWVWISKHYSSNVTTDWKAYSTKWTGAA